MTDAPDRLAGLFEGEPWTLATERLETPPPSDGPLVYGARWWVLRVRGHAFPVVPARHADVADELRERARAWLAANRGAWTRRAEP